MKNSLNKIGLPFPWGLLLLPFLIPQFTWAQGTAFTYNGRDTLGLIAQEVEAVVPEAVGKDENPDHHLALNYGTFIPILIKAVQEQQALIDTQRTENAELRRRLERLEQRMSPQNGGGR